MLVQSAVQVKIGIRIIVMPGARILTMVAIRLMPDSVVPDAGDLQRPRCSSRPRRPGLWAMPDSGG